MMPSKSGFSMQSISAESQGRWGKLAGGASLACIVFGVILLTQQSAITSSDNALQTSTFGLAQVALAAATAAPVAAVPVQAAPVVAEAVPVAQVAAPSAPVAAAAPVVAQAVPVQEVPAAAAAIPVQVVQASAVPAVANAAAAVVNRQALQEGVAQADPGAASIGAEEAHVEAEVASFMAGPPGGEAPPYTFPQYQAPAAPQCAAGLSPCAKPECGQYHGCWNPDPTETSGWKCICLNAPPPPPPGSANWLSEPNNQIQSPPAAAIAQSAMLGQYETGKIALNLDNFLKYSADKLEAQADLGRLIVDEIKQAQPCKLIQTESGGMECEVKADGTEVKATDASGTTVAAEGDAAAGEKKKGLLGLGILGLKQIKSSSTNTLEESTVSDGAVGTRPMSVAEAHEFAKSLQAIEVNDRNLAERDQDEIREAEARARDFKGDAARPVASLLFSALVAFAVVFAV